MAGLIASVAVKWALDKLASFLPAAADASSSSSSRTVTTASQDVELLRRLERTMRRIHATLHDTEEHWNIREESTKLRLKELRELAYAAEDVVEEYENEVDRYELEATAAGVGKGKRKRKRQEENETYFNDAGIVPVPMELVVQANKIIERFDEIKEYSDNFALSENDGDRRFAPDITTLRKTSSIVYEKSIIGREKDKNKIVEKMITVEGNSVACPVHVLAIVGMGGLGKTTLAQLVYNDPMVRQCFDVFAWVCVSESFDVLTITKNIIGSITGERYDQSELADLQVELVRKVQDKRVLLVLDDVWNERSDQWELLCVPMSRTRICTIIVTTRNETVAKLVQTMDSYRIYGLSRDESWSLFKQVAFSAHQDNYTPKNLVKIGKNIVEKCKGLPLAIKALGSILRCEADEVRWRDVLESKLWNLEESRSSGVLPALELSYKHMPVYLKRCFVALSLFPKDSILWVFDVIKLWKSLDLLQYDENGKEDDIGRFYVNELVQRSLLEDYRGGGTFLIMHDLIHDLACFLGAEEFFRIEEDTSIEIPLTARYISVSEHGASLKNLAASHSIRAIMMSNGDILQEELPLNWKKLQAVTNNMARGKGMLLPCRIGCAINLQTLPEMEISRCGCFCKISGLRSLNKIRELSVRGLGSVARIEDAEGAQLQRKKYLWSLALDFIENIGLCRDCEDTLQGEATKVSHKQLLDSLRPHHVLRKLKINHYDCQRYPSWLGNASYSNLTEIVFNESNCQRLPTLGELPSLKWLEVHCMDKVEKIGREFCSHIPGIKGFPSLTDLKFSWLPKLSEWSEVNVGEFPCLQTLEISWAQKLRSLPSVLFMSLVTLRLENCGNLATFPESTTLRKLFIRDCESLHQLPKLVSLEELDITSCKSLHQLPTLVSLWKLGISCCESLHQLPTLVSLEELAIRDCGSLHQLPTLVSLEELRIRWCPKLSAVGSLPSLTTLDIWRRACDDEEILYKLLNCHPSLESISVACNRVTHIILQPQSLPLLTKLCLICPNLQYCDGLAGLTSLRNLDVSGCPYLPIFSNYPRMVMV